MLFKVMFKFKDTVNESEKKENDFPCTHKALKSWHDYINSSHVEFKTALLSEIKKMIS